MQRYGMVIEVKPEKIEEYKRLHAACWPDVLKMIAACNIRNYSIYITELEGKLCLFAYFEYVGDDFEAVGAPGVFLAGEVTAHALVRVAI